MAELERARVEKDERSQTARRRKIIGGAATESEFQQNAAACLIFESRTRIHEE